MIRSGPPYPPGGTRSRGGGGRRGRGGGGTGGGAGGGGGEGGGTSRGGEGLGAGIRAVAKGRADPAGPLSDMVARLASVAGSSRRVVSMWRTGGSRCRLRATSAR